MRTVPWQVSHNPPRSTPGYPAFGEKMARPSPEKLKRQCLSQRELWLEPVEPWNFMQKGVKIISDASIPLNWKNLLVKTHNHRVGVRKHLQNTQRKSAQGTISPTFVSPRLLGPQLGTWRWLRGRSPRKCHEVAWKESMRSIKFRDMKHRYLVMSSHISYQLAFLVTYFMLEQHSNLPFVLSIQKSQIGLHAKSTVFLNESFWQICSSFLSNFPHPALCTLQQWLIGVLPGRQTPGILVHLSMAGRKGHLKQMQVI